MLNFQSQLLYLSSATSVELSRLKIAKTCCKPGKFIKKIFVILLKKYDEKEAIDNRIIPLYVTGALNTRYT